MSWKTYGMYQTGGLARQLMLLPEACEDRFRALDVVCIRLRGCAYVSEREHPLPLTHAVEHQVCFAGKSDQLVGILKRSQHGLDTKRLQLMSFDRVTDQDSNVERGGVSIRKETAEHRATDVPCGDR